ncbi:MAG TPA: hypothetical protein PLE99_04740 [Candidatus Thiothrix moscowensis]|uniref:hypothetical protein n=1 Tax=unclassified Thiothrix TaxID=2636184 RepID=UPI001A184FA9|nr:MULTISPECIES: hypothetical protein [unclassified Thiothrix]MBJ6609120.1 hypothetical protein [Candidatus Thiothrix moscowensis]HRJ52056.1 hypothetical protein [Candidatus Thiothrix moscowensis]HRJ92433.1 hypothetical protein [Candidatus Thiothrix moscowensis]
MNSGFPSLSGGSQEDMEEGFWSSFSNVMMVILKIFLLVIVVMALNNRNLLDELKHSVKAQEVAKQEAQQAAQDAQKAAEQAQQASAQAQQATQLAEFQLKENATLEEQLEYLQQRASTLEMELLRSRAETEEARTLTSTNEAEITRLQALSREQSEELEMRKRSLDTMQTELTDKSTQVVNLLTKVDQHEKQLLSLRGEYTELDKKYQKLLKPARSSKGKQVVEVVYRKSGYAIREPGSTTVPNVGLPALESRLAALKAKYGTDLYVKVVIPSDSGLSYNEAWRFTNEMLSKYDYYHQPN